MELEAYPRHVKELLRMFNIEKRKPAATPRQGMDVKKGAQDHGHTAGGPRCRTHETHSWELWLTPDLTGDAQNRRSITGNAIMIWSHLLTRSTTCQSSSANSSVEAEHCAPVRDACFGLGVRSFSNGDTRIEGDTVLRLERSASLWKETRSGQERHVTMRFPPT